MTKGDFCRQLATLSIQNINFLFLLDLPARTMPTASAEILIQEALPLLLLEGGNSYKLALWFSSVFQLCLGVT